MKPTFYPISNKPHVRKSQVLTFTIALFYLSLSVPIFAQTNVYVNPENIIIENFEGWGTSMAWWAEDAGNYHESDTTKLDDLADMLVNDLNFTTFRYNIGGSCDEDKESNCATINLGLNPQRTIPNMNEADRGLNQRRMLKAIAKAGQTTGLLMKFETFSNSPPYWMLKSGSTAGGVNGTNNLEDDKYDDFAAYLVRATGYINGDLSPYGFDVESIEPFNEPAESWWRFNNNPTNGVQEGCSFDLDNQYKMINALYEEMQAEGSGAFIAANDNFSMDPSVITFYRQNGLLDKVGRLNFHDYSGTNADRKEIHSLAENKDVWISEGGLIGLQWKGSAYLFQLEFMDRISQDLKYLRPKRWIDWQVMDTDAAWTAIDYYDFMNNGNLTPNKRFYMMQHFTKHINRGDDHLFSSSDLGNIVAFRSADGTRLSVVIVNITNNSINYLLDLGDFTGTANASAEHWITDSGTNNHQKVSNIALNSSGELNTTLNSQTISTFEIPITGSSSSSCIATTLTPYYDINNDNINWASGTSFTVDAGTPIKLGPQPTSGGDWEWSGGGTSGTSREQVITPSASTVATATFTNSCGKESTLVFNITVNPISCPASTIDPNILANGTWLNQNTVTVRAGDKVKMGPHPTSGGSWSWSGCGVSNSIATRELILFPENSCTVTATYTNSCGTQSTLDFIITTSLPQDGTYEIVNRNSGKCLTTLNGATSNGTQVVQKTCDSSAGQEWMVTYLQSGYYSIEHKSSGLFADISGQSTSPGANNIIWPDNGGNNQRWLLNEQGSDYYHIINVNSQLFLDISGQSTADNAQNIQWSSNNGQNQDWEFVLKNSSSARVASTSTIESEITNDEVDFEEYLIYPNPATDFLTIQIPGDFKYSDLIIYDINGMLVYQKAVTNNPESIDINQLDPGVFIVQLTDGVKKKIRKLVIK